MYKEFQLGEEGCKKKKMKLGGGRRDKLADIILMKGSRCTRFD